MSPRADVSVRHNGGVSFWYANTALPGRRAPLPGDRDADVCIVGGGFTGLWTAYYLKRRRPDLRIVVLEREFAGFGASGRNGGWLSAQFPSDRPTLARTHGRDAVLALQRAMQATIDEVIAVTGAEGIEADIVKHGILRVARNPAQLARIRAETAEDRAWGLHVRGPRRARGARADGSVAGGRRDGGNVDPPRRSRPARQARPGPGGRRRAARRPDLRGHDRPRDRARRRPQRARDRPRAARAELPRGVHGQPQGQAADVAPAQLRDRRHRPAPGGRVGHDRVVGRGAAR